MQLIKDIQRGKFGLEGKAFFSLFSEYISVYAEEAASIGYIESCARYLNSLDETTIESACLASIRYCNDFLSDTGRPTQVFDEATKILEQIRPKTLIVPEPRNEFEPVAHIEFDCDWEQEHGLEWLLRHDRVLYVGGFEDVYEWGDDPAEYPCNYA